MEVQKFYETNKDFREYVDRCSASRGVPASECLKWLIVKEVARYYMKGE